VLSREALKREAPAVRALVRKAAEIETAAWIDANLPRGHALPPTEILSAQVVALQSDVLELLKRQGKRYAQYVREHPPALVPLGREALSDLPLEAVLTYHDWLQSVAARREWAGDPERSVELDRQELTQTLREHLRPATGTGGGAALRPAGALPPGFATLGRKEAASLLQQTGGFAASADLGARAFHAAVADRVATGAVQGAILRDGAGRPVAAATFTTIGGDLAVRYLGALDTRVPGSGVQMIRELAGLAASKGQGLVLHAPLESEPVLAGLGFTREPDGRFALSAQPALALAQAPPGLSPA
jgi:hypothetical protein